MFTGLFEFHAWILPSSSAVLPMLVRLLLRLGVFWFLPNTQQIMSVFRSS
jgi:hypothetical protein